MAISGLLLIFFLLFHAAMNLVAVFSREGYAWITGFLGTNAIVQFMVPVLALFFIIHIIYSIILTIQNRRARGTSRYAMTGKSDVQWRSKNMFILGAVLLLGLVLHLVHFWHKMQWQEWMGRHPEDAFELMTSLFSNVWWTIAYIVWFVIIWLHLTHGFWSAMHSMGWSGATWQPRLECIGNIVTTIICLMFVFVAIAFCLHGNGLWDSVGTMWQLGGRNAQYLTQVMPL